jgi:hypothetical protein
MLTRDEYDSILPPFLNNTAFLTMNIQNVSSANSPSGAAPQRESETPTLLNQVMQLALRSDFPPGALQQPPLVWHDVAVEQRPSTNEASPQLLDDEMLDDVGGRNDETDWTYFVDSDSGSDPESDMEIDPQRDLEQSIELWGRIIAMREQIVLSTANQLFEANHHIDRERAHTSQGPRASTVDQRDQLSKDLENHRKQLNMAKAQLKHFSGLLAQFKEGAQVQ